MWECNYGSEPMDLKLLVLRLLKKIWIPILAAVLGVLLVGGPYFLKHVTFGPAKEYEAVTDFYMDYAVQPDGTEYTYFNQTTWTQLITDDVFTDSILGYLKEQGIEVDKDALRKSLYATMLSDTRIVTTTVTTNDPQLTMQINDALILAMQDFGENQKEIAAVRILQQPDEASLAIADVRTFRACMLGLVIFVFIALLSMLCYFILDDSIYVPITFERRYHVPMAGTMEDPQMPELLKVLTEGREVEQIPVDTRISPEELAKKQEVVLLVKAGAQNGKQIEQMLSLCVKCHVKVAAAILTDADQKLVKAYEMPGHVFGKKANA